MEIVIILTSKGAEVGLQSAGSHLQWVVVMVTVSGLGSTITCIVTLAPCHGTLLPQKGTPVAVAPHCSSCLPLPGLNSELGLSVPSLLGPLSPAGPWCQLFSHAAPSPAVPGLCALLAPLVLDTHPGQLRVGLYSHAAHRDPGFFH